MVARKTRFFDKAPMPFREPHHPIDPLFLERWSPRAFDGSVIPDADLHDDVRGGALGAVGVQRPALALPLRQARAMRDWERFLSLLIPFNQSWAHSASVLIYIFSDTPDGDEAGRRRALAHATASTPAPPGPAWRCRRPDAGYHAHGMAGIEYELARAELKVPERYRLEAACVIGRIGDARRRSTRSCAPARRRRDRKPIGEFAFARRLSGFAPEGCTRRRLCGPRFGDNRG